MSTSSGDLVVLAVQRKGEDQGPAATRLAVGDTLLLQGSWGALDEHLDDPDVLVVNSPELVRRQAVPLGPGAKRATAVLAAMVALLAAAAMILLGVVSLEQAYRHRPGGRLRQLQPLPAAPGSRAADHGVRPAHQQPGDRHHRHPDRPDGGIRAGRGRC